MKIKSTPSLFYKRLGWEFDNNAQGQRTHSARTKIAALKPSAVEKLLLKLKVYFKFSFTINHSIRIESKNYIRNGTASIVMR